MYINIGILRLGIDILYKETTGLSVGKASNTVFRHHVPLTDPQTNESLFAGYKQLHSEEWAGFTPFDPVAFQAFYISEVNNIYYVYVIIKS